MTSSAITLAVAGLILTFMPEETLHYCGLETTYPYQLLVKVLGALYFSFAMLNWMMRTGVIGGIYNRPISTANFVHHAMVGLGMIKGIFSNPGLPKILWAIAFLYVLFAIAFGIILVRQPLQETI